MGRGLWRSLIAGNSDKHFVGDEEQNTAKLRAVNINDIHVVDPASYTITKRFTATLQIPFQFATRSQA
jgi:hypothetical protein